MDRFLPALTSFLSALAPHAVKHFRALAFLGAAVLAFLLGLSANAIVEARLAGIANAAITASGETWPEAEPDGFAVELRGIAPDPERRLAVLAAVSDAVGAHRVVDRMIAAQPPERLLSGVSFRVLQRGGRAVVSGAFPDAESRDKLLAALESARAAGGIADHSVVSGEAAAAGWPDILDFALAVLRMRPEADMALSDGMLEISLAVDSESSDSGIKAEIDQLTPAGLQVDVSAPSPLPLVSPYTLEFESSGGEARMPVCHAETEADRQRIIAAARSVGAAEPVECLVRLGAPDSNWAATMAAAIRAAASLDGTALSASGPEIKLEGKSGLPPALFRQAADQLSETAVGSFRLTFVPPPESAKEYPGVEFTAAKSESGEIAIAGNLEDNSARSFVNRMAKVVFQTSDMIDLTRADRAVPESWTGRVVAGMEALAMLDHGSLLLTPDRSELEGASGEQNRIDDAGAHIAAIGLPSELRIEFDPELLIGALPPTPEECISAIYDAQKSRKISFQPGSEQVTPETVPVLNEIAEVLADCPRAIIEIAGHTDSQGGEEMNLRLSSKRARAVLDQLAFRGARLGNLTARGYGESKPIADNDTDEGRERNRRIEFRLLERHGEGIPE